MNTHIIYDATLMNSVHAIVSQLTHESACCLNEILQNFSIIRVRRSADTRTVLMSKNKLGTN
jgi:hypothetical protein